MKLLLAVVLGAVVVRELYRRGDTQVHRINPVRGRPEPVAPEPGTAAEPVDLP